MRASLSFLAFASLALSPAAAAAAELASTAKEPPPEVGDLTSRPGIGDATLAVPRGAILVNPGLTIAGPPIATAGATTSTAPDVLLRVGLAEGIEARGAVALVVTPDPPGPARESVDMATSFALGVQLLREADIAPALLGIATVTLPSTSGDELAGEARLSAGKSFDIVGVAANAAATIDRLGPGMSGTLGASVALPGNITPFLEVFSATRLAPFAPDVGVDAGAGIQITPTVGVDVSAGWVFLGEPSVFVSVGASLLWL